MEEEEEELDFMTPFEVATYCGLSQTTIWLACNAGELLAYKKEKLGAKIKHGQNKTRTMPNTTHFLRDDVKAWMKERHEKKMQREKDKLVYTNQETRAIGRKEYVRKCPERILEKDKTRMKVRKDLIKKDDDGDRRKED